MVRPLRRAVVAGRRDELVEQLRTLSLHVANLRAQSAIDAQTSEITNQVRAIIQAIDYQLAGAREAREALEG